MKGQKTSLLVLQSAKIALLVKTKKVKHYTLVLALMKPVYLRWLEMSNTWDTLDIELMIQW